MCGKEDRLYRASIEGAVLTVCSRCSKFGKVISEVRTPQKRSVEKQAQQKKEEEVETISEDLPKIVKDSREKLGLTQKDFANRLNEKESTIHQIESGHFTPPMELVKKLEKALKVTLVETHEGIHDAGEHSKSGTFTIGDFIKVKR